MGPQLCHEGTGRVSCSALALARERMLQCDDRQKRGQTHPQSQLGQPEPGVLALVRGEDGELGLEGFILLTCLGEG